MTILQLNDRETINVDLVEKNVSLSNERIQQEINHKGKLGRFEHVLDSGLTSKVIQSHIKPAKRDITGSILKTEYNKSKSNPYQCGKIKSAKTKIKWGSRYPSEQGKLGVDFNLQSREFLFRDKPHYLKADKENGFIYLLDYNSNLSIMIGKITDYDVIELQDECSNYHKFNYEITSKFTNIDYNYICDVIEKWLNRRYQVTKETLIFFNTVQQKQEINLSLSPRQIKTLIQKARKKNNTFFSNLADKADNGDLNSIKQLQERLK